MKIEIDIKELVQKIDINKLIEEKIISDISDNIDIQNIVDEVLDDKGVKSHLNKKVADIIDNYIDSEEGKNKIIYAFNDEITNLDCILGSESIIEIIAEFLKRKLM